MSTEAVVAAAPPARDGALRRVARNTGIQTVTDAVTKLATIALYVALARAVGDAAFGAFTVATSIVLLVDTAGLGTDVLASRDVARDRTRLPAVFWAAGGARAVTGAIVVVAAVGYALAFAHESNLRDAVLLLAFARYAELLAGNAFAIFRGLEQLGAIALALLAQRALTVVVALVALQAGGGVATVSGIYLAGALVGLAVAQWLLVRRAPLGRPRFSVRESWTLLRDALPLGISNIFVALLARVDTIILAALASSAVVGAYGAAYRLFEGTFFLSWALGSATLAALSRLATGEPERMRAMQISVVKVATLALGVVGGLMTVHAHTIIDVLYGQQYDGAVTPLRWLGVATAFNATYVLAAFALTSMDHQRDVTVVTALSVVVNVALNLVLCATLDATGAALAMAITQVALAAGMAGMALRRAGSRVASGLARECGSAVLGAAAMAATLPLAPVLALPVSVVVYGVVVLAVERALWPADLGGLAAVLPFRVPVLRRNA